MKVLLKLTACWNKVLQECTARSIRSGEHGWKVLLDAEQHDRTWLRQSARMPALLHMASPMRSMIASYRHNVSDTR